MIKMKNFSILLSTVAVILAAVSLVMSSKKNEVSVSEPTVSAEQVAEILKDKPEMVVEALNAFQVKQEEERLKAENERRLKYKDEINSSANAPFVGPEDAKVTVVEFFDFSCGYCKRIAPAMEKVIADNADVKFVFKPLSFVSPVSSYQAKAAMAMNEQGKFVEFYKAVMAEQGRMTEEKVNEIAEKLGADMEKYKKDVASEEVSKKLNEISDLSHNIQVRGVPSIMINGESVRAITAEELQDAINNAK